MVRRALLFAFLFAVLTAGGCASTGSAPKPFPRPGGNPPVVGEPTAGVPGGAANADPYSITGTALALRGAPYRNGGSDPSGFDCSGFVWYIFAQHGIQVPRTVTEQFHAGTSVDVQRLQPGDLVFFATTEPGPSHVGVAIGGDEFIHAPSTSGLVRVEHLGASYWATRFVGARRVL